MKGEDSIQFAPRVAPRQAPERRGIPNCTEFVGAQVGSIGRFPSMTNGEELADVPE